MTPSEWAERKRREAEAAIDRQEGAYTALYAALEARELVARYQVMDEVVESYRPWEEWKKQRDKLLREIEERMR